MDSLQRQFPQFPFSIIADEWIRFFKGKSLPEQLRDRRIARVLIAPLLFSSGGIGIAEDGNFFILLNDMNLPGENAESLGHEIAHTFHHDLTQNPPKNFLPSDAAELIEDFCRVFSEIWLRENEGGKIATYCRRIEKQ